MGWGCSSNITKTQKPGSEAPFRANQGVGPWANPQVPLAASVEVGNQQGAGGNSQLSPDMDKNRWKDRKWTGAIQL